MKISRRTGILVGLAVPVGLILVLELVCRALFPIPPVAAALPEKPPGTFRVITVGGSTVRGLHVPELGFVAQLEAILHSVRPERAFEVRNYGKGARSSTGVRAVVEATVDDDPDLYVILTGHNEFLFRSGSGGTAESVREWLRQSALFRAGQKAVARLSTVESDTDYVLPKKLVPYDRESAWWKEKARTYLDNLDAILELAGARGIPVVLCTAPANLLDWPPVYRGVAWASANPDHDADIARIEGLLAAGDPNGALAAAEATVAAHGPDAMMSWLSGQALAELGQTDEARDALHLSVELDPYPWRVLPEFNERIREMGSRPGVHLVDVERTFEEASENGLVGFDLVSDNCHPTPLGNAIAALAIAATMSGNGLLLEGGTKLPTAEAWLDEFLAGLEDEGRLHELRVHYMLENGIYCMKTPFRNYETSETYFASGIELAPDNWVLWANHGTLALLTGEQAVGEARLAKAAELRGAPLDRSAAEKVPYLLEATARTGIDLAALSPPE